MKHPTTLRYLLAATALGAVVAVGSFLALTTSDGVANLRRYAPEGHHFVDVTLAGGEVTWTSREVYFWRVRERVRRFGSTGAFEEAFRAAEVGREAAVDVHLPSLNLDAAAGRDTDRSARALLAFLVAEGYREAGFVSN